jgi:hypothetical protein
MNSDGPPRKSKGRLTREDQRKLGDLLKKTYDEVLQQGVPDRFKSLLKQLDSTVETRTETSRASPDEHFRPPELSEDRSLTDRGSSK